MLIIKLINIPKRPTIKKIQFIKPPTLESESSIFCNDFP